MCEYSVVIPVLNEKENLEELLPRLLGPGREVIVCDNGSTDGTVELVQSMERIYDVRLSEGSGTIVDALLRGIALAGNDRIILMDGDLSHPPEVVPDIAQALSEYDMVVGSRYCKGGVTRDTFRNKFISRGFNLLSLPLAPMIRDRASGFFGIRKGLTDISIRDTVKPMLEYLVKGNPVSVKEVPYVFSARQRGKDKTGRSSVIVKTLVDLAFLYLQKYNRFIKFCIVGGIGTLIVLGVTYFFTEVVHFWYMLSVAVAAFFSAVWNFTGHKFITYAKERAHRDCDYEWNSWFRGNPLQKYWKRQIGKLTKKLLGSPDLLLDIGCGSSPVINLFRCSRIGLDRDQSKLDFIGGHSDALFLRCDLSGEDMPTFMEDFDAVICNNVLEHLENPERVVEGLSKRLKVGGEVVLTVPNWSNPFTRLVEWVYGLVLPGGYAEEHCYRFTPRSLDKLCSKYGLDLVDSRAVFTDTVRKYRKGNG